MGTKTIETIPSYIHDFRQRIRLRKQSTLFRGKDCPPAHQWAGRPERDRWMWSGDEVGRDWCGNWTGAWSSFFVLSSGGGGGVVGLSDPRPSSVVLRTSSHFRRKRQRA